MVARTIGRLIWLPFAFVLSAMAALAVLATLGLERLTHALDVTAEEFDDVSVLLSLAESGFILIAGMTVLPALAFIIIGEVARIRSSLYYILAGGVAVIAIPILARYGQTAELARPTAEIWQIFATAGFAGGFVYWLIAGRYA